VKLFLLFAVPPLAGAVIGFVTNVIAIRMLFRPLREIRLFGIRLPFTPGILPRQRHKLAESIGGMVERELLTPELLRVRLQKDDVRKKVLQSLSAFTERLLAMPLGNLFAANAGLLAGFFRIQAEKHYGEAAFSLISFLRRDSIRRELEARGRAFLQQVILNLNVFQRIFLSAAQYDTTLSQRMPEIVEDLINQIQKMVNEPSIRKKLMESADGALERLFASPDKNLQNLFSMSAENKKALDEGLCSQLLRIAGEEIENVLASINIKTLVSERIDSLDMIRVEKIILDVMANQLKWIDVFGAILGFAIGFFQSFFSWLLR
jgi:uncharacterized membrane protein YheB (UPF0754 family)